MKSDKIGHKTCRMRKPESDSKDFVVSNRKSYKKKLQSNKIQSLKLFWRSNMLCYMRHNYIIYNRSKIVLFDLWNSNVAIYLIRIRSYYGISAISQGKNMMLHARSKCYQY